MGIRARAIATVLLVVAGCGTGCLGGGEGAAEPPANGGFSVQNAVLYEYAYAHCLRFGTRSAHSHPSGSNPVIYSIYPVVMIGTLKPHGKAEWQAAKDGCALAIVRGFSHSHSSKTAALCTHLAPFLPARLPECGT